MVLQHGVDSARRYARQFARSVGRIAELLIRLQLLDNLRRGNNGARLSTVGILIGHSPRDDVFQGAGVLVIPVLLRGDLELFIAANAGVNDGAVLRIAHTASSENVTAGDLDTVSNCADNRLGGLGHVIFLEARITLVEATQLVHLVDADLLTNQRHLHHGLLAAAHGANRRLSICRTNLCEASGVLFSHPGKEHVVDELVGEVSRQGAAGGLQVVQVVVCVDSQVLRREDLVPNVRRTHD